MQPSTKRRIDVAAATFSCSLAPGVATTVDAPGLRLVPILQRLDRSGSAAMIRCGQPAGASMGMLRAVTFAFLATWGLVAMAAPAGADGTPDRYPTYDATPGFYDFKWSGFYAGGHLGLGHTNAESTEQANSQLVELITAGELNILFTRYAQSETSITGGLQVGWQRQWEKFVAGVELGFTLLRFDTTTESPLVTGLFRSAELSDIFTLTGRLGYADGRWLAYAKGGVANAQVDVRYLDAVTGGTSSSSGRETGWTAGIGIDYALTPNLFLGVEYNYLHFRADVSPPPIPIQVGDVDVDVQNVVVRLNYRFGPACCIGPGGHDGR
jgi:opacity protein-like surface antigen